MHSLRSRPPSDCTGNGNIQSNDAGRDEERAPRNLPRDKETLIKVANKKASLNDVFAQYNIVINRFNSEKWSESITCPFPHHKGGKERTPSFGYNFEEDRFNCFGCSSRGGAVEFISLMERMRPELVAEQLIIQAGGYDITDEEIEKKDEGIDKVLFAFAIWLSNLTQKNRNNKPVLSQIEKVNWWFDNYFLNNAPRNRIALDELTARIEKAKEILSKYE